MAVRTASINAYRNLAITGERERKNQLIIDALMKHADGLTRRELEDKTGLRSNQVTGRVRELLNQGRIEEPSKRECSITGNEVGVVRVPGVEA